MEINKIIPNETGYTLYVSPTIRQENVFLLNGENNNFKELECLFRQAIAQYIKDETKLSKKDISIDDIYIVSHKFAESDGVHHITYKVNTHLKRLSDAYFTIKTKTANVSFNCVGYNNIVSFNLGHKYKTSKRYGDYIYNREYKLMFYVGEYKDPTKYGRRFAGIHPIFYNKPKDILLDFNSMVALENNLLYETFSIK
jgi:hypothetical protein